MIQSNDGTLYINYKKSKLELCLKSNEWFVSFIVPENKKENPFISSSQQAYSTPYRTKRPELSSKHQRLYCLLYSGW